LELLLLLLLLLLLIPLSCLCWLRRLLIPLRWCGLLLLLLLLLMMKLRLLLMMTGMKTVRRAVLRLQYHPRLSRIDIHHR